MKIKKYIVRQCNICAEEADPRCFELRCHRCRDYFWSYHDGISFRSRLYTCVQCNKGNTDVQNGRCLKCLIKEKEEQVAIVPDLSVECLGVKADGEKCKTLTKSWHSKCHHHTKGVNLLIRLALSLK